VRNVPAASSPVGLFLLNRVSLPWGILVAMFFWLFAVFGVVVFVMRVGAWHRYRREARELLRGTGRKLPALLRWYS